MRSLPWLTALACLTLALALPRIGFCDRPLPFYDQKDLSPYWLSENSTRRPAIVLPFRVSDQEGQSITERDFSGRISVVNFFFGQCGSLCPLMMSSLQKLQNELGKGSRPRIFSFSVTPERDTPAELKSYARARGLDLSDWSLLTGDRREIYRIGEEVFRANHSPGRAGGDASFTHSSSVYLVDAQRRIRGIYDARSSGEMAWLRRDILQLRGE